MAQTREQPASHVRPMPERLAGAPICPEHDTAITADEPAVGRGALRDVTASIAFINSAQTEEIHR